MNDLLNRSYQVPKIQHQHPIYLEKEPITKHPYRRKKEPSAFVREAKVGGIAKPIQLRLKIHVQ